MAEPLEPLIWLAMSMQRNKGAYALLIGSGVSRSAGVPTGQEIVEDLARQIARLENENCEPDPVAWYTRRFGKPPSYSALLNAITKSPAERSQILRSYFEPNDEERENGLKVPTKAHDAIARIVAGGYVRVVVTVNFDRLLEKALAERGVEPTVVSTADAAQGAPPLAQANRFVLKLHGDYLDSRIKNTPEELARYDRRIDRLLDQIFDQFGLIVCGWSGDWDTALGDALSRCASHRYTTYWTVLGNQSETALQLIRLRRAEEIKIGGADEFFSELADKLEALETLCQPHPLSAKVAIASAKRYLADRKHRIELRDLVNKATEELYSRLSDEPPAALDYEKLVRVLQGYEAAGEVLRGIVVTGCYWGDPEYRAHWSSCLVRLARPNGLWASRKRYPALLLLYAGGIAAVASGNYSNLGSILWETRCFDDSAREVPLIGLLNTRKVLDPATWQALLGVLEFRALGSRYLFRRLRGELAEFLPDDLQYQRCFDRFEYLLALVHKALAGEAWPLLGFFACRDSGIGPNMMEEMKEEVFRLGDKWPPLAGGLFDGSSSKVVDLQKRLEDAIRSANRSEIFG